MTYKEYLLELKKCSPYDFSEYSDNSIQRRIQKILDMHNLTLEKLHAKTLSENGFVEQLVNEITVNTTDFYRDPEIWIEYFENVLPLFASRKQLKVWHAGTSTGQEVYSHLMLLHQAGYHKKTMVLATDINQKVLNDAKNGTYRHSANIKSIESFNQLLLKATENDTKNVNIQGYLRSNTENDTLVVASSLLANTTFKKHDLVSETAPFSEKFDIIFCRNVLIYFNTSLQSKILKMFHDNLNPGGILVLGNHESLNGFFKTRFVRNGSFYVKNNAFHYKQ